MCKLSQAIWRGAAEIVEGYVEDALLTYFHRAKSSQMERFLESSPGSLELQSCRAKISEKRYAHDMLEKGGTFTMRSLHHNGSIDSSLIPDELPACSSAQKIANHEDIKNCQIVCGWPGASNWHFAGVDAVRQPDTLYQATVSERLGINTDGLAAAVCAASLGRPGSSLLSLQMCSPTVKPSNCSRQSEEGQKAIADSVRQILLELLIRANADSNTAEYMEVWM